MAIEAFCDRAIVFSLCAVIFFLPVSIALLDSFAGVAIFFYFLKKINRIEKVHFIWRSLAPPANFLNRPLQILALAFFISVLFSQYPGLSLYAYFGKFLKSVFLYLSFIEVFRDEKRIQLFLKFLFLSTFITVLSGIVQHYTGKDFLKGHLIGTENFVTCARINSSFFTPNGFGAYLLPVIGLIAHLLFKATTKSKSWILGGALALFLVLLLSCLCWTYSRSSWIGYLAILFIMVLMDRRKALLGGVLLCIFIFVFLPSLNHVRHLYLINDNSRGNVPTTSSFNGFKPDLIDVGSGRLAYWGKAVSITHTSPVYGTGLNTYTRIIRRDPNSKTWWYAHNCYLQIAAETGLLGLACFLWMLFVLFLNALNHCKQMIRDSWQLTILQGAIAGLFGFLVQSFFDNTFYTVQLGVLMWLIFGLTVAVTRLNPPIKS